MKRFTASVLVLLIMTGMAWSQTARPSRTPRWDNMVSWILNGQETLTYKTLTSPTITSPTISSPTVSGLITLANGEVIGNATDAFVTLTFNDSAAAIGTVYIMSSIDSSDVTDNQYFNFAFRSYDDSLGYTNWVNMEAKVLDVSDQDEDSHLRFAVYTAGAVTYPLKLLGEKLQLANGEEIDNDTDGTIAFTDGTNTLMSIVDAGTVGNVTFSGKVSLGADTDLTLAAGAVTVTHNWHQIAAQGAQTRDSVITFTGGADGMFLVIAPAGTDTIVVDAGAGGGNIIAPAGDVILGDSTETAGFIYDGAKWLLVFEQDGS